jgi:hypothetical protein
VLDDDARGGLTVEWFKVESAMASHRKTRQIPRERVEVPLRTAAMGAWWFAACWSAEKETDGFIPAEETERFDPDEILVPWLVKAGYFEPETVGGERGFILHDWLDIQKSTDELQRTRANWARKAALHRDQQLTTEVRDRDKDRCRYCGTLVRWNDRRSPIGATYDHVDPEGGNTIDNVVVCCRGCNSTKGDRTPEQAGMPLLPPGATGPRPTPTPRSSSVPDTFQDGLPLDLAPTSPIELEVDKEVTTLATESPPSTRRTTRDYPPDFEAWWKLYPRSAGKRPAALKFEAALKKPGVTVETLMIGVKRYAAAREGKDPQFTLHAKTWLNEERWNDPPDLRVVSGLNDY